MSEFKYLSDGRKVVVVGQLNNQETIVQEVFVTGTGDEIPSGERFVTKSLHDEPVLSYKAKEEQRSTQRCKELGLAIETKNKELREMKAQLALYKKRIASTEKLVENVPAASLDMFTMFLSGSMEYLVPYSEYSLYEPVLFTKATTCTSFSEPELKLLSVFGKSNGDLEYRVNHYSDGSGGWTKYIPCASYEAALEAVRGIALEKIEADRLSEADFEKCVSLGIAFPIDALEKYNQRRKLVLEKELRAKKQQLEKAALEVSACESKIGVL